MKLLAIIPLGFLSLFIGTSYGCWHDLFWPECDGMRLITFGVALSQTSAALVALAALVLIVKYVPWKPK